MSVKKVICIDLLSKVRSLELFFVEINQPALFYILTKSAFTRTILKLPNYLFNKAKCLTLHAIGSMVIHGYRNVRHPLVWVGVYNISVSPLFFGGREAEGGISVPIVPISMMVSYRFV